jgi:hypothetical protein
MNVNVGYEIEMCTPLDETAIRAFFKLNKWPVKDGIAANHQGPYDKWGISIDGSVMPDKPTHNKFELISPIMPLYESLEVLRIIFDWMKTTEGYTNRSTGFHVGVSIDDKEMMKNLDPLKLVVLLEEDMILKMFDRQKSHWCQPIKKNILSSISNRIKKFSGKYDFYLSYDIDNLIRKNIPESKGFAVNLAKLPNYIEFRAMGDTYSKKYKNCQETILHYAECVKAACNPSLYVHIYEERYKTFLKKIYDQNPDLEKIMIQNKELFTVMLERDAQRRSWRNIANKNPDREFFEIIYKPKRGLAALNIYEPQHDNDPTTEF